MNNNLNLFNQNNCDNDDNRRRPHFQPIYFVVAGPTGDIGPTGPTGDIGPTHTLISESKI